MAAGFIGPFGPDFITPCTSFSSRGIQRPKHVEKSPALTRYRGEYDIHWDEWMLFFQVTLGGDIIEIQYGITQV